MGKKARGSADFIWSLGLYGASSESALSFFERKGGRSCIWSLGFYLGQVAKPAFSTIVTRGGTKMKKMVRSNYDGGSDRSCYIGKLPYWLINRNEETPLVSSGVFS